MNPADVLQQMRGIGEVCGCGRELMPSMVDGKQVGVEHTTLEDEDYHMEFFRNLLIK